MISKMSYKGLVLICLILIPVSSVFATDPANNVSNGWCYNKYKWNGTSARRYYPANGGCSQSVYSPLIVIMRGNGFDISDYHYLGRHLAKNGFISAIVDPLTTSAFIAPDASDYQATADKAWAFVDDFVWKRWSKRFYIDPSSVGLIGHSRGGEAVRYLADKLANDPLFDVKAVVGLAPTNHTNKFLGAGDAVAALYIHGSKDGDVPPRKSIAAYDRTGNEASQNDPAFNPHVLEKAFKLLLKGNHASFTSEPANNSIQNAFGDIASQRLVTQGYVLAYLKAHLANDFTWYQDYIRGDSVPGGYPDPVYTQFAEGFHRRVIDHFENGVTNINSLAGLVEKSTSVIWNTENLGLDNENGHSTFALAASSDNSNGWIKWNIPWGKRNATDYDWLSLRIGQRSAGSVDGVKIQLLNSFFWSAPVQLSDYGPVAVPTAVCLETEFTSCLAGAPPMEHMSTIHIPLSEFGFHFNVRAVRILFEDDAVGEEFLIDNIAFTD